MNQRLTHDIQAEEAPTADVAPVAVPDGAETFERRPTNVRGPGRPPKLVDFVDYSDVGLRARLGHRSRTGPV